MYLDTVCLKVSVLYEPCHEETFCLHLQIKRYRSASLSACSWLELLFFVHRYRYQNPSSSYFWNFYPLATFCGWTVWFVLDMVWHPEDRFLIITLANCRHVNISQGMAVFCDCGFYCYLFSQCSINKHTVMTPSFRTLGKQRRPRS